MQNNQAKQSKKNTAGQGKQTLGGYEGILLHSAFKIKLVNVKIYKRRYRLHVLASKQDTLILPPPRINLETICNIKTALWNLKKNGTPHNTTRQLLSTRYSCIMKLRL